MQGFSACITCLTGFFSSKKEAGTSTSFTNKAKAIIFGTRDDDEFIEEELSVGEEEESRKKATIDGEIMTKMADVNNHDIPVLSLDDQAAIVDKGVDFSKPFNAALVQSKLADVMREQLPPDAPPMTTEELLSMKDTVEKTADPETSKAIANEKKEASLKNSYGTSPSGSGFLERAKIFVEEAAHKVGEEAENLVENIIGGNAVESDEDKPSESNGWIPATGNRKRRRPKVDME